MRSQTAALLPFLLLAAFVPRACGEQRGPNVVLIVSDNMAWHLHGFMGHDLVQTPNLDRLAAEGMVFTRGYVTMSLCRPSLMSLVTGLYPHQTGITGNDPSVELLARFDGDRNRLVTQVREARTVPRLLAEGGYLSFQAGKWWEGSYRDGGFTHGMTRNEPDVKGDPRVRASDRARHGDLGLLVGKTGLEPVFRFIEAAGQRPFFLWYSPQLPHESHDAPERLMAKYEGTFSTPFVDAFFAKCEWFDETVGELMGYLKRRGIDENTLVIYLSDNGGLPDHVTHRWAPRSLGSYYDTGLRTPIVLRWPGRIAPGRDAIHPVSSLDLPQTILAACGIFADLPGADLLQSGEAAAPPDRPLCGAVFDHDIQSVQNPVASLRARWCVAGPWKLILPSGEADADPELYDVQVDAMEVNNLAAAFPDVVARLSSIIDRWWLVAAATD